MHHHHRRQAPHGLRVWLGELIERGVPDDAVHAIIDEHLSRRFAVWRCSPPSTKTNGTSVKYCVATDGERRLELPKQVSYKELSMTLNAKSGELANEIR